MLFYGWWLNRWNASIASVQWSFCTHQWCIMFSEKIATPLSTWFRTEQKKAKILRLRMSGDYTDNTISRT